MTTGFGGGAAFTRGYIPRPHRGRRGGVSRVVDMSKPFRRLKEFCEQRGIVYLNEHPDLVQGHAAGTTRFKGDCHLNEMGSRMEAEFLAAETRKLLASP